MLTLPPSSPDPVMPVAPAMHAPPRVPAVRITPGDAAFPVALHDLQDDVPEQLWVRGDPAAMHMPVLVAIVGTRRATSYGVRVATELGAAFARAGACVVSGMARGIDAAAHRGCIENGGRTIAVLGTGIDVVYPPAHRQLQRSIALNGALVSELHPLDHGMKFTFPRRNRIIAALAKLTIVVEAPGKSGALVTSSQATDLGRIVAAVPGPIDQPVCAGSNALLGQGAQFIGSPADALALVGLTPPPRTPRGDPEGDEGRIWAALAAGPLDLDSLCSRSGLPAARCMAAVTALEIAGSLECALSGEIRRR